MSIETCVISLSDLYVDCQPLHNNLTTTIFMGSQSEVDLIQLLSDQSEKYNAVLDPNWSLRFINGTIYNGYRVIVSEKDIFQLLRLSDGDENLVSLKTCSLFLAIQDDTITAHLSVRPEPQSSVSSETSGEDDTDVTIGEVATENPPRLGRRSRFAGSYRI